VRTLRREHKSFSRGAMEYLVRLRADRYLISAHIGSRYSGISLLWELPGSGVGTASTT
jgi:hypothetical protein